MYVKFKSVIIYDSLEQIAQIPKKREIQKEKN